MIRTAVFPAAGKGCVSLSLELEGEWVDAGTIERYPQAFVQMTLADPVIGEKFREYL